MFGNCSKNLGLVLATCAGMVLVGCGSVVGAGDATGSAQDDLATGEIASLDSGKAVADVAVDGAVLPDTGAAAEVAAGAEVAASDAEAKCPGAPGCSCKENGDCDNAQCLESGAGKVCATPCVDKCEDGFKCALVNSGGGDSVTICVPKFIHLCDPCMKSKDCQSPGMADSACVSEGGQGNFCATACTADGDCAAGYACQTVTSVEGAPVKQCVKTSTSPELKYGECVCSDLAKGQKAQTSCYVEHKNDKGELIGKCAGVRQCAANGLTTCAAPEVDVEVCDGKDNDCDGLTDEATCDGGNPCNVGTCDPQQGCQYNKLNNVPCDADKNACTENDQCKQGSCVPGPGKVCDDGNPCTTDSCDPASGCTKTVDDGKACDADGNACTTGDHCEGAACTVGKPVVCDNTNPCSKVSCEVASGKCVGKSAQDGVPCDDGTVCTQADHCQVGECIGKIVNCDDNNTCTANSCDKVTGCSATNLDGAGCDDDNPCTVSDLCKGGLCQKGIAKVCDSGASCVAGTCNLISGKCDYKNKAAGAPCNDGDACSDSDACSDGACQGKALNCDDGNPCSNDSCDAATGCVHKNNVSPCSDGDACTQSDNCVNALCVPGPLKVCEDNVLCTADSCNKTSGACVFDAVGMNGTPCDDGNVCTLGDNCKGGICAVGIVKDCNDNNPCTDDLCDKVKGCNPNFNAKACDDANACTKDDICKFGDCEGSSISCNDGNPCTDDACDAKKGCIYSSNSAICDDSSACTTGDACKNSVCGGALVNCDDGNICSDDTCDKKLGCVNAANIALCPDSDACTTAETCKDLKCVKKAVVCDDANECTLDTCDAVKGCQVANVVDKTLCSGGAKWCMSGKCQPKAFCGDGIVNQVTEECDDGNVVNNDSCTNACKSTVIVNFILTPCGAKGPTGPDQAQCDAAYAAQKLVVKVVGGIQQWTVPSSGNFAIEAFGAQGGNNAGKGARMKGTFALNSGDVVQIVVGQQGLFQGFGSGGGGGSFVVVINAQTPLLVAGGGGGAGHSGYLGYGGSHAVVTADGVGGNLGSAGAGGVGGTGGASSSSYGGTFNNSGGGAGWLSDGQGQGTKTNPGKAFKNGAMGGLSTGGFGGAGGGTAQAWDCSNGNGGGSGGGGYSGGGGGGDSCNGDGGGAGSFNAGANPSNSAGVQVGDGKVTIVKL